MFQTLLRKRKEQALILRFALRSEILIWTSINKQ